MHDKLVDKIFPQEDLLANCTNPEQSAWVPEPVADVEQLALMNDPYAQADKVMNWPDQPNPDDAY